MKTCQIILQEKLWEVLVQTSARGRDDLFCLVVFICFCAEKWTSANLMTFFFGLHLLFGGKTTADVMKTQKYKHCSSYHKIIQVKRLLLASTLPAIQAV